MDLVFLIMARTKVGISIALRFKRSPAFSDLMDMKLRSMAFILAACSSPFAFHAHADDPATAGGSKCYGLADLMRDLRYGHCSQLQFRKGRHGGSDACPSLLRSLNQTPQLIISNILDESTNAEPFSRILSCKYVPSFIHQGINRVSRDSGTLLHESAQNCDKDRILLLRVFGAGQMKDRKGVTPEDGLIKTIDRLKLSVQLESNAAQVTLIQKQLTQCTDALKIMQAKNLTIADVKGLGVPLDSKIAIVQFGKASGAIVDQTNIQTAGTP